MIKRYKKTAKKVKRSLAKKSIVFILLIFFLLLGSLLGILYYFILRDLPSPTKLGNNTASYSTQIYDRHNTLLYTIYSDRNQTFVPLEKIPIQLQQATIAVEDKDFYNHGAIDIRGIMRALVSILFHRQLQGGSTLTQQLVKSSLLTPERTITRKIKEVFLAYATELMYPKNKILEMYLNQVPYGGTSYGVEAAAQTFFGKNVKDLTLAENAYLAGLPEAPSTFSPFGSHPELGKKRQEEILYKMAAQKYISSKDRDNAITQQLKFQKITNPIKAPHFVFYIKDLLAKKYGTQIVEQGGLKVYTSLDLAIQDFAQETVASEVATLKNFNVGNGGALITNPGTGEILAMIGSTDYFNPKHGNVNTTLALLQPGSSIKPLNYAVGLMNGYSASTPFIDQPICFLSPPDKPYCPRNYDGKFHGVVDMRTALGNSLNIPAVQMLKMNGIEAMIATASAMGITTFKDASQYGLSLTLGGGEVMMTDMATAFGVFANEGYRVDLHPILKITDRKGTILEEYTPPKSPIFGKKVLPPEVAYIISDILADNNARTIEFGSNSELRINKYRVSVKTGTTNDFRDNWTIGYTPSVLVAVWVGNNDHTPMSGIASGITGAAPIWHDIMSHMLIGKKPEIPQKPANIISKYICNGIVRTDLPENSAEKCSSHYELFIKGIPQKTVTYRKEKVFMDKTTNNLATPGQTDNVEEREESFIIDPLGNKYCLSCSHVTPTPVPKP
jgi:penicillin-binding protein 1C